MTTDSPVRTKEQQLADLEATVRDLSDHFGRRAVEFTTERTYHEIASYRKANDAEFDSDDLRLHALTRALTAYGAYIDCTNEANQLYDADEGKYLPWLTVKPVVLGIGGQAYVFEGQLDLGRMNKKELGRVYERIKAWELAKAEPDDDKRRKSIQHINRKYITKAKEEIQHLDRNTLERELLKTYRKHIGPLRNKKLPVAIKITKADLEKDKRSARELRVEGRLSENSVYSAFHGTTQDNKTYLVSELVKDSMHWADTANMTKTEALRVGVDMLREMNSLDQLGIVHRDIKPQNILINTTERERPKLFGLFKRNPAREHRTRVTDFGMIKYEREQEIDLASLVTGYESMETTGVKMLGTRDFMSPEQALDSSKVDHRSDICAIGYTLYFYLTGKTPNHNMPAEDRKLPYRLNMQAAERTFKPDVPDVNRDIQLVLAGMMQRKLEDRYQTYSQAIEDLNNVLEGKKPEHVYAIAKEQRYTPGQYLGAVFHPLSKRPSRWKKYLLAGTIVGAGVLGTAYAVKDHVPFLKNAFSFINDSQE